MTKTVRLPALLGWQYDAEVHAARFKVEVVGRRSGKSYRSKQSCLRVALRGGLAWWISRDYPAAQEHWREILEMALQVPGTRVDRSNRTVTFPSGGRVSVKSASTMASLRGSGLDHISVDEAASYEDLETLWEEVLRPSLADKKGSACFPTTPNGYNYLHKLFVRGQDDAYPEWASWQIPTWEANPFIDVDELDALKSELSESSYRQEIGAEFVAQAGRVYPEFSRQIHARKPCVYNPALQTSIGIDFGLRSFAFQLRQFDKRSGTKFVLADRIYREMTTAQAIQAIKAEPFAHLLLGPVTIGVDPAGSARNIQTKRPDVDLIREAWPQAQVLYSTVPEHRDPEWRAARQRDMLMSADGTVRVYIDPSAKHTIEYLEQSVYPKHKAGMPERTEPVKDGVVDHMRDADGYGDVAMIHLRGAKFLAGGLM